MPDAQVDLFTDQPLEDPVFDRVHLLSDGWFRPKMEALRRSRFARTIILDADILVLEDISELFDLLDRHDIAGALGVSRSRSMVRPEPGLPRCAPLVNTGVLAVRNTAKVEAFLQSWEDEVRRRNLKVDQGAFRRLLYRSDLRFVPIPYEYNIKHITSLESWSGLFGAPRVLHQADLHKGSPGDPDKPLTVEEALPPHLVSHVAALRAADWSLGRVSQRGVESPVKEHLALLSVLGRVLPVGWMRRVRRRRRAARRLESSDESE